MRHDVFYRSAGWNKVGGQLFGLYGRSQKLEPKEADAVT
jgi:hypothetical protein